jgi:hypothetical protein
MTRLPGLSQWQQIVSTHLPHLSKPQVVILTLWSLGIVVAQRCGLTSRRWRFFPSPGQKVVTLRKIISPPLHRTRTRRSKKTYT